MKTFLGLFGTFKLNVHLSAGGVATEQKPKRRVAKKDPNAPTGHRSAYQIFLKRECDRLKSIHGALDGKIIRKMAVDMWQHLSEKDKQVQPYFISVFSIHFLYRSVSQNMCILKHMNLISKSLLHLSFHLRWSLTRLCHQLFSSPAQQYSGAWDFRLNRPWHAFQGLTGLICLLHAHLLPAEFFINRNLLTKISKFLRGKWMFWQQNGSANRLSI